MTGGVPSGPTGARSPTASPPDVTIQRLDDLAAPPDLRPPYGRYLTELAALVPELDAPATDPQGWWEGDPWSETLVARGDDGAVAGFAIVGWGPRVDADVDGELCECWVAPAWRRRGVGAVLLDAALRRLPERAGLQAHAANAPGLAFWRHALAARGIRCGERPDEERGIPVVKLRFAGGGATPSPREGEA